MNGSAQNPEKEKSFHGSFLANLENESINHPAVNHPYLIALEDISGPILEWGLRDFAQQYYGYSSHFQRFLTLTISKLENPNHRQILLENLFEENGHLESDDLGKLESFGIKAEWVQDIPHPALFNRFRLAVGVDPNKLEEEINVVCWRESLYSILLNGTAAEAVGALGVGTEGKVKYIYRHIIKGIENYGRLSRENYVFFELHCEVDDQHHELLLKIAEDFSQTEEGRLDLRKGMQKALNLRLGFWDWMFERLKANYQ